MNKFNSDYKKVLIDTLEELYPNYLKKKIIKEMADSGRVVSNKRQAKKLSLEDVLDVSEFKDEDAKLSHILNYDTDKNLFKYIEEFEFNKSFRHSVMFKLVRFSQDNIKDLIEEKKIVLYKRESDMIDIVSETEIIPTLKIGNENVFVKFSYLIKPKLINSELKPIKYIVLCDFDLENNLLEIRFDKSPQGYHTTKDFYVEMVNQTIDRLYNLFDMKLDNIDFKALIEYIRTQEDEKIYIYAMEMHRNGSKAYLDSMSNADMTIPILGELKEFINSNEQLFNANKETKDLKGKLDNFIEDIEGTSDLPSIKVIWPENDTRVGIKHDYKGEEYSLFMYYDELIDSKEKMDYVRNYFTQHYKNLNS
ncbi:Uncharacterised protein [[Clostridium] sordellii]|uniref:hypothetical protein n=1 Tax=Paraclostridium sordellii TaxID=1505 RepID=UPI0005E99D64|nr:hypothetical protein [Paeniclostridium sordellii]CEP79245.1 Uncharacterised protein [[Clostridium] sordellii] [Paeniclostridium sordellii]